jgi:hypothetical protein
VTFVAAPWGPRDGFQRTCTVGLGRAKTLPLGLQALEPIDASAIAMKRAGARPVDLEHIAALTEP